MKINVNEISKMIQEEVSGYREELKEEEVGTVLDVGDGIAKVYGLKNVMASEMVEFENGVIGMALNLEEDSIGVVILGDYLEIEEGVQVKRLKKLLSVPVGEELLGRVVNPLGEPIDGLGEIRTTKRRPLEIIAPGIAKRQPVNTPLQTGIKAIDSMIPIGRGQRELIIGDRSTGKTTIGIDTIINQRDKGVICVYVAIGQKASTVVSVVERLKQYSALDHSIIVVASASDPAPMLYIAPYAGCSMAEYFMFDEFKDTLCIYDDLTKQANAYRQLSLLLQRPPGREAFPGDVFYLHSRLLERSVKLSDEMGGGSLTALPIVETQEGEVSAYIPTNVISITDGQIYLTPKLFASGVRPAIDVGISVSRVGGKAQISAMKEVSGSLRLDMAQYRSLEAFAQIATDLDTTTQRQLNRGNILVEILKQEPFKPNPVEEQILIFYAGTHGFLDSLSVEKIRDFEKNFFRFMREEQQGILDIIRNTQKLPDADTLNPLIEGFVQAYQEKNEPSPIKAGVSI